MFKKLDNIRGQIFLTSAIILFLELALIRYLPANISYLGYYSNFILLASFIGMGTGMLLARKKYNLEKIFSLLLLITVIIGSILAISIYPDPTGEIHFTSIFRGLVIPEFLLIPAVFLLVAATFVTISQRLGRLFTQLPPLVAYRWDIWGSLSGIILFTAMSFLQLGPVIWFSIILIFFLLLNNKNRHVWLVDVPIFILILIIVSIASINTFWSPYQKLQITRLSESDEYVLSANNVLGHQRLQSHQKMFDIYHLPYDLFAEKSTYQHALIIGAGTGNDVAMALSRGVKKITAVEIDPTILALGKEFHPDKPYDDPRVVTYIDDARSFLQRTQDTYDLIIFALPDSVLLASGRGNIRLESFLFTQEAFTAARQRLAENGLLVLYNFYRQPWLVDKLGGMLNKVFNQKPYILSYGPPYYLAILMAGEKLHDLSSLAPPSITLKNPPPPATDNWPFLYLKTPHLPWIYILMLGIIGFIIYLSVSVVTGGSLYRRLKPVYFFLGLAFLLLETTALIRFSLLFGTTWLVNSFVFFAILSLVLLAIILAEKISYRSLPIWYAGLIMMLILQFFIPLQSLLSLGPIIKYLSVSLLTLLPVFFANIIFSITFKSSKDNDYNFASNILGAGVGGMLEYTALLSGYRNLIIVILACYILAFILATKIRHPSPDTGNDAV